MGGDFITTMPYRTPYDAQVDQLEKELADLLAKLKAASVNAPESSGNVAPAALFASIEDQINKCVAALEALRMGRGSSPQEVQAVEKKLLAVERQILNVEAQQFSAICASVSVRNRLEQRLSELRQQAEITRGQLQVFTGRQQDAERRKYLLGDTDAVRRALVNKSLNHQSVLDDLLTRQKDNDRKLLEARRGAQDAIGKKRIAELEQDQRRLVAMIAATQRQLEGSRRDLEQFDQRTDDDKHGRPNISWRP
jgi:hypothetical protein